ncbi:DNA polymerase III subunit epsilon [Rhabdaerophilum calidifontis]|uniref:DNA polymerase III subunit epsilon n=1 Tax=Rhabdaerophilum calidifontis TaxID=2604328 RepID=UPI00123BD290|nr:DNA polymerase III subunit epsilon [Rhabdaerophilum calidifontis]
MREIVLDTETTGLDPQRGDRLVEIGCVEIVNRFVTGRVFHRYLNPERAMPAEAFAVHGLSDAFLADKPLFAAVVDEFLGFIGEDPLVIHNAAFDTAFLNAELKRAGRAPLAPERIVDTLTIARRRHPGQQNSLDALCARYGVSNAHRTKHGALLDAEILADIYAELTGGKQSSLGLGEFSAGSGVETKSESRKAGVQRLPRIALATADERARHRAFIAEIGEKALWNAYIQATEE